jgi:hypothetical protein
MAQPQEEGCRKLNSAMEKRKISRCPNFLKLGQFMGHFTEKI